MLADPKDHPDERIYGYLDLEVAKNPEGHSSSGRHERGNASRFNGQTGRGGKGELRELIIRVPDEAVRHSSSFVLAEIKIDPQSIPAPLTSTEKLSEGPPC